MSLTWLADTAGGHILKKILDATWGKLRGTVQRRKGRPPAIFLKALNESAALLTEVSSIVREAYVAHVDAKLPSDLAQAYLQRIVETIFKRRKAFGVVDAERAGFNVAIYWNAGTAEHPELRVVARYVVARYCEGGKFHPYEIYNRTWTAESASWVAAIWRQAGPVWTGKTVATQRVGAVGDPRPGDIRQYNSFLGAPIGARKPGGRPPAGVLLITAAEPEHWSDAEPIQRHLVWLLQEHLWMLFWLFEKREAFPLPPLPVDEVQRHPLS